MHSDPDSSGHGYAANHSFRDFRVFKRKIPRLLSYLNVFITRLQLPFFYDNGIIYGPKTVDLKMLILEMKRKLG